MRERGRKRHRARVEKQSQDGSIHDVNNTYTWDQAFSVHVAGLNGTSFAGHSDWRLPNVRELDSIVNYENFNPAVSPAFNNNCTSGCTVLTCSCTALRVDVPSSFLYWSSTTDAGYPSEAWLVIFHGGGVTLNGKGSSLYVRAVRGGS